MSEQPNALRMADILDDDDRFVTLADDRAAAAELRRQHAELTRLRAELAAARKEIERLNDLLESETSHVCRQCGHPYTPSNGESENCPKCGYDGKSAIAKEKSE